MIETTKTPGQVAYEAYARNTVGPEWPEWERVPELVRAWWQKAAEAVIRDYFAYGCVHLNVDGRSRCTVCHVLCFPVGE